MKKKLQRTDIFSFRSREYKTLILFFIIIFAMCPCFRIVYAASKSEKHILIINPFTQDYPGSQLYIQGIKSELEKSSEFKFNYSYEYLDLARHNHDDGYLENIGKYLKSKYLRYQPDFIITAVNCYPLLSRYASDVFPNVPVVIDWDASKHSIIPMPSNYYLVSQFIKVDQNIDVILKTKPLTKKIYMVLGDSIDERNIEKSILYTAKKYKDKVDIVLMNKLKYEDMLKAIEKAEDNSAILYFQWYADVSGKSFIPTEVVKTICEKAKVPVYGVSMQYIGNGIIGGYVGNQELVGQTAASVVLDIFNKKEVPTNQTVRTSARVYTFDWRQLKRWNISESRLPAESVIKYMKKSVWDLYKQYIIGCAVLVVLEAALIIGLLINRRKRKKAEVELLTANTSLEKLTEELICIDKMKDEFLITTSHELKTPLNGIINISEMLAQEKYGSINIKQMEELNAILSISRRLSLLIRDIIDIEKIKRNKIHLEFMSVDIKSASVVVVEVFKLLAQSKGIEIKVDIPENLSPVYADENRLLQVMYNLMGNGIKFTENGVVTLSAEEKGDFVKISVEDTGIGILEEKQEKLFEAFESGVSKDYIDYEGSGMGLYISKQLLERMNGHISLEWSEFQKGSCFSFMLPKASKEAVNKKKVSVPVLEGNIEDNKLINKSVRKYKILAVDDEPTNLRVLQSILDGEEYKVLTSSNGIEALEILKAQNEIDIVLIDVMMPQVSGYEVCRKIREKYSLYDLPIIILTVRDTPDDIEAGFNAGANDFITKPFVAKELRARVSNLIQMKKSVQSALKNEMAFLQSQIKPHFLYNAMSTIMSFCYTDGTRAGELLGYLSEYLQKSFNIDNTASTVSLQSELELTKAYTEIEKARFGERLAVEYDVDESLMKQRVLPLIIQPLVENSIRHGLMKRKSGGTVKITIGKEAEGIRISIQDDGIGTENVETLLKNENLLPQKYQHGVGLSNIKRRLMKYYGTEIYVYSKINEGTQVFFTLPINNMN